MMYKDFKGYKIREDGQVFNRKGQVVKGWDRNGYKSVAIGDEKFYVHRLVAQLFCEGYCDGQVVDHIDRDPENNHYTNLRWVTRAENALNSEGATKHTKVSDEVVLIMVNLKNMLDLNNRQIADITGIDRRNVSRILNGRSRSKLTGIKRNASI